MGITEVTVPKQYVLVQATEPTGAFEGQLWYDSSEDLTYIFQDGDWQLITLDISQEVLDLATENAMQQIDIIELQANASVAPFDHDTLLSDTFSDADGYKDSVNTTNTTATFNTNLYKRTNPTDLTTGLMSYYKLDETSGTTATDTTGAVNGTSTNVTVNQTGKINKAYLFKNASNGYISLGDNYRFQSEDAFSLTAWIYPTANRGSGGGAGYGRIYDTRPTNGGSNGFYWSINPNNGFTTTAYGVEDYSTPNNIILNNQWSFVVYTRNSNGLIKMYVNNVEVGSVTRATIGSSGTVAYIGRAPDNTTLNFDGLIDEFGIWNRVLTADEITALYNSGAGLSYDNFEFKQAPPQTVEIDLPTITGTVTHTELVINGTIETGASIKYKLYDDTESTDELDLNTKNQYSLTNNPEKMEIILNPKETKPTNGNPSIKSYCLKLWKA